MVRCASVKSKREPTLQCPHGVVFGSDMCGTHLKGKVIKKWKDERVDDLRIIRCQSLARRWLVQRHLRIAGPCVLARKNLANEDDVLTSNEKERVHPFEYFSFEENGKIWWFEFGSIWKIMAGVLEPVNPYTRTPLSPDTRKRLREMWALRVYKRLPPPSDPADIEERIRHRWNVLCQMFIDNGFVDATPDQFVTLPKGSYITIFRMILNETDESEARIRALCRYMLHGTLIVTNTPTYILNSIRIFLRILMVKKQPYDIVFLLMSALFRC